MSSAHAASIVSAVVYFCGAFELDVAEFGAIVLVYA